MDLRSYRKDWVFGGVASVVVIILAAAAIDPTGKTPLYVGAILPIILLGGILLYQWKWSGTQAEMPVPTGPRAALTDDLGQVEDYWQMFEEMAVAPIDPEAVKEQRKGLVGVLRANIVLGAILALLPIGGAVIVITGKIPAFFDNGHFFVAIPFILVPAALVFVRWSMKSASAGADATMKPLGLELTGTPTVSVRRSYLRASGGQAHVSGASVMEGERHGRRVKIRLASVQRTEVAGHYPVFELRRGRGGRLRIEGHAPAEVSALVDSLGPSPHWKKLKKASGGAKGIAVERGVDGESGWMWDLWLAKRLAGVLSGEAEAQPVA